MSWLLVLPVLIPLATAAVGFVLWGSPSLQRLLGLFGAVALLASTVGLLVLVGRHGIVATQLGDWPAPFGITFVADHLSAIMVVLTGIMGLAVAVYSLPSIDTGRVSYGYYPLYHVLLAGINGAFLTGDVFNLFVWFEVMLISSFVLLALGGERAQLDGAVKYVIINLVASALFLSATGLLYGLTGSLNMADIAAILPRLEETGLITAVAMMFLIAFGVKAGVFPLFFWLPASYHTPPVAVSAIFSGMLTKVGVYTLIRFFTLMFNQDVAYTHTILLWISGLTMITGVLGAAAQNEFRRILSFHIISQIGYMIMGLALYTPLALIGSVFYITHHIIVKTNLFLVSGVAHRLVGSFELKKLGGLYQTYPLLGVLFLIPAFSLAGFPPLSGFWAKFILVRAGLETSQYAIVAVALVVGLLTLFSMTKIWNEAFWKALPQGSRVATGERAGLGFFILPIVSLAIMTIIIGLYAEPFFALAERSAEELLSPAYYIEAVLGGEMP